MGSAASQHAGTIPLPQLKGELHWSHYGIQGKRDSMEDAFLAASLGKEAVFGVFDGHYGKRAAQYTGENLAQVLQESQDLKEGNMAEALKNGFLRMDRQVLDKSRAEGWQDGTTALVALLAMTDVTSLPAPQPTPIPPNPRLLQKKSSIGRTKWGRRQSSSSSSEEGSYDSEQLIDDKVLTADGQHALSVFIANAGDCRALSMYGDGRMYQLSTDHNPLLPYERWRIYKAGGNIKFGRIEAKLSVSRGFGDRQFKEPKPLVSAMPEIVSFTVTKGLRFVLLACDGVWGWLNNYQVSAFVAKSLKDGNRPDTVCKELVKYAYDHGSTDNISVVLLYFTFEESESPDRAPSPSTTGAHGAATSKFEHASSPHSSPPHSAPVSPQSTSPSTTATTSPLAAPTRRTSKDQADTSIQISPTLSRRPEVSLTASARNRKFNFVAAANATTWNLNIEQVDQKYDRAGVVTTHIPTGGDSSYTEHAEYDSTTTTSEYDSSQQDGPGHGSVRTPLPSAPAPRRPSTVHQRDKSTVNATDDHEEDLSSSNQDNSNTSSSPRSESDIAITSLTPSKKSAARPIGKSAPAGGLSKHDAGNAKLSVSPVSPSVPMSRRSQYSAPAEDEDDVYTSQKLKFQTPQVPKRSGSKQHRKLASDGEEKRKARAVQAEAAVNYGLSDSEESEGTEDDMKRRKSFDDARTKSSSKSHSSKSSQPSKSTSTPLTKKPKKKSSAETGAKSLPEDASSVGAAIASSPPSSSAGVEPVKTRKKKSAMSAMAEDLDVDIDILRRAHSFDSTRPTKPKKKSSK